MIETRKYRNREDALEKILILDKDYTIIRHDFKKGEIIEPHKHDVDEWVIFDSGKCKIIFELESLTTEAKDYTLAVYLPKNKETD